MTQPLLGLTHQTKVGNVRLSLLVDEASQVELFVDLAFGKTHSFRDFNSSLIALFKAENSGTEIRIVKCAAELEFIVSPIL